MFKILIISIYCVRIKNIMQFSIILGIFSNILEQMVSLEAFLQYFPPFSSLVNIIYLQSYFKIKKKTSYERMTKKK